VEILMFSQIRATGAVSSTPAGAGRDCDDYAALIKRRALLSSRQ